MICYWILIISLIVMEDIIIILPPVYSVLHTNYNIYPGEGAVQSRDDMLHSTLATREGELFLS